MYIETYVTLSKRQQITILYDMKQVWKHSISTVNEEYHRRGNDYEAFQKTDISAVAYFYSDGGWCYGDGRKQWTM